VWSETDITDGKALFGLVSRVQRGDAHRGGGSFKAVSEIYKDTGEATATKQ